MGQHQWSKDRGGCERGPLRLVFQPVEQHGHAVSRRARKGSGEALRDAGQRACEQGRVDLHEDPVTRPRPDDEVMMAHGRDQRRRPVLDRKDAVLADQFPARGVEKDQLHGVVEMRKAARSVLVRRMRDALDPDPALRTDVNRLAEASSSHGQDLASF